MATLDNPKAAPMLGLMVAGLAGYLLYSGDVVKRIGVEGIPVKQERIVILQDSITALTAETDSIKRDVSRGTLEELKGKIVAYRGTLAVLRQLVPDQNEVPNLLDDIITRAKIRGVNLSEVVPQPVATGPNPFDTYAYKLSVVGKFDQIGEFLSDIASLRRIIVPYDVALKSAQVVQAKALGDTTGVLLEANFQIRTYVKAQTGKEGGPSGN